jgi:hypothetical protein
MRAGGRGQGEDEKEGRVGRSGWMMEGESREGGEGEGRLQGDKEGGCRG